MLDADRAALKEIYVANLTFGNADWLAPVTDEQYAGLPAAPSVSR
jgi:hypothetical protein